MPIDKRAKRSLAMADAREPKLAAEVYRNLRKLQDSESVAEIAQYIGRKNVKGLLDRIEAESEKALAPSEEIIAEGFAAGQDMGRE